MDKTEKQKLKEFIWTRTSVIIMEEHEEIDEVSGFPNYFITLYDKSSPNEKFNSPKVSYTRQWAENEHIQYEKYDTDKKELKTRYGDWFVEICSKLIEEKGLNEQRKN